MHDNTPLMVMPFPQPLRWQNSHYADNALGSLPLCFPAVIFAGFWPEYQHTTAYFLTHVDTCNVHRIMPEDGPASLMSLQKTMYSMMQLPVCESPRLQFITG